jgi:hypothetical protein
LSNYIADGPNDNYLWIQEIKDSLKTEGKRILSGREGEYEEFGDKTLRFCNNIKQDKHRSRGTQNCRKDR